jgi:hypothetical protein
LAAFSVPVSIVVSSLSSESDDERKSGPSELTELEERGVG